MKLAKASALVIAFVGAVAFGVWIGPHVTQGAATIHETTAAPTQTPVATAVNDQTAREVRHAPTVHRAKSGKTPETSAAAALAPGTLPRTFPAAAPALHQRLKSVLNKGADMGIASEDFGTAAEFATVAYASRNTKLPFMVLKHRVVYEGKTLEDAITEFRPDLNAAAEVQRAQTEAESDTSASEG